MKKLVILFLLLFLAACNPHIGESRMVCGGDSIVIESYNDQIRRWTLQRQLTRDEFDAEFSQGMFLTDDEIHELFDQYHSIAGISTQVVELNSNYLIIAIIYDYTVIPVSELSRMWGVDDFEDSITLSVAISALEEEDINCEPAEPATEDEDF